MFTKIKNLIDSMRRANDHDPNLRVESIRYDLNRQQFSAAQQNALR